jgi:hypothetical protein
MTHKEIQFSKLGLSEGIELDNLIAEKVMGWHKFNNNGNLIWVDSKGVFQHLAEFDSEILTYPFAPSSDLEDAWMVVDKVYIHSLRRVVSHEPDAPALWQAHAYADSVLSGIGETPQLAICRAALLVVMEQGK